MEKIDKKWLAGFFDGEGSTGITVQEENFQSYTSISQSDIGSSSLILEDICSVYGGKVRPTQERKEKNSLKKGYVWSIGGDEALVFLTDIQPHLKVKNRETDLVIKFIELQKIQRGDYTRPPKLTRQQRSDRFSLFEEFLKVRDSQYGGIAGNRGMTLEMAYGKY